jgi:hypothetical protein
MSMITTDIALVICGGLSKTWKFVAGYRGAYEVSSDGEVASLRDARGRARRKIKSQFLDRDRYLRVNLCCDGHTRQIPVHRLIALAFLSPPLPGQILVRHLDGNSANNSVSNLAWGTSRENSDDAVLHGRMPRGEQHWSAKLSEADVREIRCLRAGDPKQWTYQRLADQFGVCYLTMKQIVRGIRWRHVK